MVAQRGRAGRPVLIGLAALLAALGATALLMTSSLPDAGPVVRAADDFPAPTTWKVGASSDTPSRIVCLGDDACPSSFRSWVVPADVGLEDFLTVISTSGWRLELSESCMRPFVEGRARSCLATGATDGVPVTVAYRSSQPEGADTGTVTVTTTAP